MIVDSSKAFIEALASQRYPALHNPTPRAVMLVQPEGFYVNSESALDNHYMDLEHTVDADRAVRQFQGLVKAIRAIGTEVVVFPGDARTPDDVFPNNVFATVPGRLIIGHMRHPIRQQEAARRDIPTYFRAQGYEIIDLRERDCVAELTGVLIMDRSRRIGFCGLSERVDREGAEAMHEAFKLKLTYCFELTPDEYHTNVVFSVLAARACVLYPAACADSSAPDAVEAAFPQRTLLLDKNEKDHFVGNCISLNNKDLFMSQAAADALRPASLAKLESWGFTIHSTALDELEKAGGSLRCMVAKMF